MIRVGIIGCGKIAQVRHLPEYAANPNAQVVAYYDKNMARAEEMAAKYGGKVYDSFYQLIDEPDIDAVSICVENRSHAEICTAALYAGKHVLCEKPMAVTLAECESMVAAAERNGKHLMIGHNMRFDPVHRKARKLLESGIERVVISLGGRGALYLRKGSTIYAEGLKVPVGSTVGAGDSVVAALAYAESQDMSEEDAVRLSTATGAANVMCSGTQAAERSVIEELLPKVRFSKL